MVWGDRFFSYRQIYLLEIPSIIIVTFLLLVVIFNLNLLPISLAKNIQSMIYWIMAIIFGLNTLGNFVLKNKSERRFFTPTTLILTTFSLILALGN